MEMDYTQIQHPKRQGPRDQEILSSVYQSLQGKGLQSHQPDRGVHPSSEDPTYITNYNNARAPDPQAGPGTSCYRSW